MNYQWHRPVYYSGIIILQLAQTLMQKTIQGQLLLNSYLTLLCLVEQARVPQLCDEA